MGGKGSNDGEYAMMPELKIKDRDGQASLWVDDQNIWDLPHDQLTSEVLLAIKHAYEVGRENVIKHALMKIRNIDCNYAIGELWNDMRKDNQK